MLPDIRRMTTERLKFEIAKGQVRDGKAIFLMEGYRILTFWHRVMPNADLSNGCRLGRPNECFRFLWTRTRWLLMMCATPVNADIRIAKDVRFVEAALSYVEDTMFIAEIVRLLPRCLVQ